MKRTCGAAVVFVLWPLLIAFLPVGCSSGGQKPDAGEPDGTDGEVSQGDEGTVQKQLVWSQRVIVDDEQAGMQIALAAMPDGQNFAIAYFKRLECTGDPECQAYEQYGFSGMHCSGGICDGECSEPILGGPATDVHVDLVAYAWSDGFDNWQKEQVHPVANVMLPGISLAFDGQTPLIGYLGGTPAGAGRCAAAPTQ
ncbi:MAG: hypothetical protein D6806_13155 [Deltaproteobacteria bacterium]|nr:MAG: hypothetical protein D6806_13155 [Deltaproteobacteria bacterium]